MGDQRRAGKSAYAAAYLLLTVAGGRAEAEPVGGVAVLQIPPPPAIDGLIGLPQTYSKGRGAYLALITRQAELAGLPPAIADAVAKVESSFNPNAVGGVGEVGLMQIRPQTAAMLGYKGSLTGLFEPETNVRYAIAYLARAWQLAKGDVCRTLMKYRAGWGEERMTPLSVEYCSRAREHLAAIGSPYANGALPSSSYGPADSQGTFAGASPPRSAKTDQVRIASLGPLQVTSVLRPDSSFTRELKLASAQIRTALRSGRDVRTEADSKRFWTAHEARIRELTGKRKGALARLAKGV